MKRLVVPVLVSLACGLFLSHGVASAQEKGAKEKPAAVKQETKPLRRRLPNYFAAVVTKEQRAKVYEIQAKYHAQLEELRQQIALLEAQRDKEIDAVLTPEQLAEVNKKRAEAKQRSQKRGKKPASN